MSRGKIKISEVFSLRGRAVPGDTWRAHFASPRRPGGARRHMAGSPLASPRRAGRSSCLRADACGFGIDQVDRFLRLRGWRTMRTQFQRVETGRPSCESPRPKAFPALGIHPASGTTSFFILKRRSMRHNAVSYQDYRGQHPNSQLEAQAIRSTPRMQFERVSPFDFVEAKGAAGRVRA